jgi:hypothetical protein
MIQFTEKLDPVKVLQLLSTSVPYYLKSWHEIDQQRGLFGSIDPRSHNMRAVATSSPVIEYVVRPHLNVVCILAAYLYRTSPALDQVAGRAQIVQYVVKGLRWACDTHLTGNLDVESFLERKRWGENWRSGLWTSLMSMATFLAKEHLPGALLADVKRVLAFEADRFVDVLPPSGCEIDTKLEENAQDVMVLAWAINMIPHHDHLGDWQRALSIWALNVASSVHDRADHTDYLDSSISRHISTQTLFPDMTAENHGFFHPLVLSYSCWIVAAMAAYALHDHEEPSVLKRKHHQQTFDILLRFCLPTGMLFEPSGQDLPLFIPRPMALAWGLWHNDPRALRMTGKLLAWMDALTSSNKENTGQWVLGFKPEYEGWELFFQSQVGFELAMLAALPFKDELRFYSSGQIESAVDTRRVYPYIQVCYRRNTQTTRSVAWKAIGNHPTVTIGVHPHPELIASYKAQMLGIPALSEEIKHWDVAFHHDRFQKDGFDTYGRIWYRGKSGERLLRRDIRVLCWGEEGIILLDRISAESDLFFPEQYLSPLYLVNDVWTGSKLTFCSGSLREVFAASEKRNREISCPSFWASVENHLLLQFVWGRTKGLVYLPGGERNAPAYWENCRMDMLAVRVEGHAARKGDVVYQTGLYVGVGKGPKPFKSAGTAGEFFKGLVIMDGKNTIGLD